MTVEMVGWGQSVENGYSSHCHIGQHNFIYKSWPQQTCNELAGSEMVLLAEPCDNLLTIVNDSFHLFAILL